MIQLEVVKFYIGNTYVLQIRNKKGLNPNTGEIQ